MESEALNTIMHRVFRLDGDTWAIPVSRSRF